MSDALVTLLNEALPVGFRTIALSSFAAKNKLRPYSNVNPPITDKLAANRKFAHLMGRGARMDMDADEYYAAAQGYHDAAKQAIDVGKQAVQQAADFRDRWTNFANRWTTGWRGLALATVGAHFLSGGWGQSAALAALQAQQNGIQGAPQQDLSWRGGPQPGGQWQTPQQSANNVQQRRMTAGPISYGLREDGTVNTDALPDPTELGKVIGSRIGDLVTANLVKRTPAASMKRKRTDYQAIAKPGKAGKAPTGKVEPTGKFKK